MHDPATTLPQSKPVKHPHFAHPSDLHGGTEKMRKCDAIGRGFNSDDARHQLCANYGQQLEKNVVVARSAVCDALQTR